jgi:hypothetical protein
MTTGIITATSASNPKAEERPQIYSEPAAGMGRDGGGGEDQNDQQTEKNALHTMLRVTENHSFAFLLGQAKSNQARAIPQRSSLTVSPGSSTV